MPRDFKTLLKSYRLRAGFGLRRFAELIGEQPGNYAGVESGQRKPWRSEDKLRQVANALGLEIGSTDWDAFFIAAGQSKTLAPDLQPLLDRPWVPVLLRTVNDLRLTDDELRDLVQYLNKHHKGKLP